MYYNNWSRRRGVGYGLQQAGFNPAGKTGSGRTLYKHYLKYQREIDSDDIDEDDAKDIKKAAKKIKQYRKEYHLQTSNPWGESPDGQAAKLAFERRFLQNDRAANIEYTELQRKKYGYYYQELDPETGKGATRTYKVQRGGADVGDWAERERAVMTYVPGEGLTQTERYKLWRYDNRYMDTERRIGSGYDKNYNPLGLKDVDATQQQAFEQDDDKDFKAYRTADRSAKQGGKASFTAAKGVQL